MPLKKGSLFDWYVSQLLNKSPDQRKDESELYTKSNREGGEKERRREAICFAKHTPMNVAPKRFQQKSILEKREFMLIM
jgi:uncharacterized protein YqeY